MLYQLQSAPTSETHGENIIRLYVRDANNAPVSNARVKVYAGPPPTGNPPYFEDDFPFRATNPSGLLEYFAVAGIMPETRDYWTRVIDNDGNALSDPVQFHFAQGATIWITAILRANPTGAPTTPTQPIPPPTTIGLDWDARLTSELNILLEPATISPGQKYWKLIRAKYLPPGDAPGTAQGRVNIYYTVLDENGFPVVNQKVWQQWPDDRAAGTTDGDGVTNFGMTGDSSFDPKPPRSQRGPYSAYVDGLPSDKVVGLGLPLRQHVVYELTWRKTIFAVAPPSNSSINGTIANAPSGTIVMLTGTATKNSALDGAGNYSFTQLAPGPYSIAIGGVGLVRENILLDGSNSAKVDYAFAISTPTPPTPVGKSIAHYLLFGAPDLSATRTNFILALDYIARFAPTVGFSAFEAQNAQNVTVVGSGTLSADDEQMLNDAGCLVRYVAGADSYAVEQIFADLIVAGNPYPGAG
ncbi:MAG: carboxypeptidase regulatory-like domain-containing protein [Chloroflexi bacterium]|nr:carboxypeptidase regulatory-like domain-containing protein [Chloroflexota bacterium]